MVKLRGSTSCELSCLGKDCYGNNKEIYLSIQ